MTITLSIAKICVFRSKTSFLAFGNVDLFQYLNCVQDRRLSDVIMPIKYIGPVFTELLVMKSDLVMLEVGVDNHA